MMPGKPLVRDIEKRIIAHFMDLLILSMLNHDGNEISGYDLIKYFNKKFGLLMSPGTVYLQLYSMERKGLLNGRQNRGKTVFTLTQHGKKQQ
jgi:DNA-binding PadR family transcriptional regulator